MKTIFYLVVIITLTVADYSKYGRDEYEVCGCRYYDETYN